MMMLQSWKKNITAVHNMQSILFGVSMIFKYFTKKSIAHQVNIYLIIYNKNSEVTI